VVDGVVLSVETVASTSDEVFDLEVEEDHNYFVEGVLVSNSAAASYRALFKACDHIYFRFGLTGTFFRSGTDALAMYGLLANVVYRVTSTDLLQRNLLVPTRVVFVPVPAHPKLRGVPHNFSTGHGHFGIHEHRVRNQLVTQAAVLLHRQGRKVLVLVGTKSQGRELREMIEAYVPKDPRAEFKAVEFVSTDTARPIQNRILDSYLANQEVKILIGTSLLGEGVDLPDVDALVYARGEQAEVTLTQSAYRVCTAVDGKRDAVIVDFADRHHRKLLEHSLERLEVYYHEPIFRVDALDDAMMLPGWIEKNATVVPAA
jgi:superfamily II DNA or RNA helicase